MSRKPTLTLTLFIMLLLAAIPSSLSAADKKGQRIGLWAEEPPHDNGDPKDEAYIQVFLPEKSRATGRAVVICPGGAYCCVVMDCEGTDWAPFFTQQGIAAIVLHYRLPHGNYKVPIEDAEQAMRVVRRNAKRWNINPEDVGIMGSSAGGHLASTIATHAKGDALPDFQILFYPVITMDPAFTHRDTHDNFLGKDAKKKMEQLYSNDTQVTRQTPRAWIALADDDNIVVPANGFNYYFECYRHDVPASLHIYPYGGHWGGMRTSFPFHAEMLMNLKSWLSSF